MAATLADREVAVDAAEEVDVVDAAEEVAADTAEEAVVITEIATTMALADADIDANLDILVMTRGKANME